MKWTAKIGTFTARRCCFCEYWLGPRPMPVPKAIGIFEYEDHANGSCRHQKIMSQKRCAGGTCGYFEAYTHLH